MMRAPAPRRILRDNQPMRQIADATGSRVNKVYRLYTKPP